MCCFYIFYDTSTYLYRYTVFVLYVCRYSLTSKGTEPWTKCLTVISITHIRTKSTKFSDQQQSERIYFAHWLNMQLGMIQLRLWAIGWEMKNRKRRKYDVLNCSSNRGITLENRWLENRAFCSIITRARIPFCKFIFSIQFSNEMRRILNTNFRCSYNRFVSNGFYRLQRIYIFVDSTTMYFYCHDKSVPV